MGKLMVKGDDKTITVRVPIAIRKRGGKKLVIAPDGKGIPSVSYRTDNSMVKALARAFRWQQLLENGTYATIVEIAEAEKIDEAYVGRVLRLTLLAPDTIERIVNGRNSQSLDLASLMRPFPVIWTDQRARLPS